jgi:WD40 repeat protein
MMEQRKDYSVVRIRDSQSGALIRELRGHTAWVRSARFSSQGDRIVTASFDGSIRVWNVQDGRQLLSIEPQNPFGYTRFVFAAFSHNGQHIVSANDGVVEVWDANSGKLVSTFVQDPFNSSVYSVVFSPDDRFLLTANEDRNAYVLNAQTGAVVLSLEGHTGRVNYANFTAQGDRIVTVSDDGTAKIWNAKDGDLLATLEGHTDSVMFAAFNPAGDRLVTTSNDHAAIVWDVHLETRTAAQISEMVRQRVPYHLDDRGRLVANQKK